MVGKGGEAVWPGALKTGFQSFKHPGPNRIFRFRQCYTKFNCATPSEYTVYFYEKPSQHAKPLYKI